MDERLRFVAKLLDGESMTEVCREFGISRKTGYRIFQRYKDSGVEALSDRSRRPMHRKRINISAVLAGQRVGIKEVDEGIWIVSFMQYDLGYIDLEQQTLQPLDNPFGARLSPMS
jgi:Helix-turn-helix domain